MWPGPREAHTWSLTTRGMHLHLNLDNEISIFHPDVSLDNTQDVEFETQVVAETRVGTIIFIGRA